MLLIGRAPLDVYKAWTALVQVYCKLPAPIVGEPKLILQRNVTLNEEEERRICQRNPAVLELLYHEARCNVLDGRYYDYLLYFCTVILITKCSIYPLWM